MKPQNNQSCSIYFPLENITVESMEDTVLKKVLKAANIPMDYPCGGKGSCHKCKILVRAFGSEDPWEKQLACKYRVS